MKNQIRFMDGEINLNDDGTMTFIGEYANKIMFKFIKKANEGTDLNKLFDAVNNCAIVF